MTAIPDLGSLRNRIFAGDINAVLTRYADILLAVLVMAIVAIIIVPMPMWLLDLLLAANITLSVTILMISLYVPNALALASFPSILLVTTLFRLGLNISSTRMILTYARAGEVIKAFGKFVVGGDYVVGFVVFVVILIVQFIVIAKGAERVSEVAARFTLDALPGKQMSIDADLRSGIIDIDEARRRRLNLARESQFYGNMDGAMKFVKGDAIAGILICLVNILAGLAIGVLKKGMAAGEAARVYTLLTVGDGLVSALPSLVVATAAGIITTRVASGTDEHSSLGKEIGVQILSQPKAIAITSVLLLALAIVPGLPAIPFLVLATLAAGTAWGLTRTREKKDIEAVRAEVMGPKASDEQARLPMPVPILVEMSKEVTDMVDVELQGTRFIQQLVPQMRDWIFGELGVTVPGVRVRGSAPLAQANSYVIYINEIPVATGFTYPEQVFVHEHLEQLALLGVDGKPAPHPSGPGQGLWIGRQKASELPQGLGNAIAPDEYLALHLAQVLRKHGDQLLGIQDVQNMLDTLDEQGYGALVKSVIPELLTVQRLTDVLRRLLREDISIRNMRAILEALAEWARYETDPVYLTERVRIALKRYIAHRFGKGRPVVSVYVLDPRIEQAVADAIHPSPAGSALTLDPQVSRALVDAFAATISSLRPGHQLIVVTQMEVRYFVKRLLELQYQDVVVLSFQELPPDLRLQPIGRIMLPAASPRGTEVAHAS
ncbi:MAG: type III secretion system export apparatus subunit SctV [Thermoanaerobaculia bacterium]